MKKIYYTWREFNIDIENLAEKILKEKTITIKNIYGIPRGGLIVAVCLSHLLNLPIILRKDRITKHTLVVDDICDTGRTLAELSNYLKRSNIEVATLFLSEKYSKDNSRPIFMNIKQNNSWIVYPWEI